MKMLSRLAAILTLSLVSGIAASFPSDWKYFQSMRIEGTGFLKVSLPIETLDAARSRLEDLRLYDGAGRETPFRIELPTVQPIVRDVKNFQIRLESSATIVTFETSVNQPVAAILLETPSAAFIKAATVEGSTDGQNWQTLVQGLPLFRQRDGASLLELKLTPSAWARLRVTLDDQRSSPIPLIGARIRLAGTTPVAAKPLGIKIMDREESPRQTRLVLQAAGAHAILDALEVDAADALFSRSVTLAYRDFQLGEVREHVLTRGMIFRVAVEGQRPVANVSFADGVALPSRELLLIIENGDSPPLTINAVRAQRRLVYAAWQVPQAGEYHWLAGNAHCVAPQYDLAAFPTRLTANPVTAHSLSPLTPNPAYRTAEALPEYREVGTPIDLNPWRCRKRILIASAGVCQVELDLETLSQAMPGFADLRVIKDGQQLPYLLERAVLTRTFTPQVEKTNDTKRPTVSLWRLKLPFASVPATQLTCETEAPFFQRNLRVLEQVPDSRGELHSTTLSIATWTRAPGQTLEKMTAPLSAPVTDTLTVELENGDNPPIALKNFQAHYPVTRIIFKTAPGGNTYLYFGNRRASTPRYDLDLAARQLLDAEKIKSGLGPVETLKKTSWLGGDDSSSPQPNWVFWLVLGLVVTGLLIVIARLLPKAQGNGT